jgi:hypothetical protein
MRWAVLPESTLLPGLIIGFSGNTNTLAHTQYPDSIPALLSGYCVACLRMGFAYHAARQFPTPFVL